MQEHAARTLLAQCSEQFCSVRLVAEQAIKLAERWLRCHRRGVVGGQSPVLCDDQPVKVCLLGATVSGTDGAFTTNDSGMPT